ncbi:hypothetical protein RGR602_PC00739 (plasmid) [Rhizobium gallicum bv. gallicum R602sp]|uniref:Uncharacterized protein n=1 Tax=Rhizobium gallicum bv. gallicum R602sp TaxID=1041138 RepID=A0A0B4XCB9_9HYPH|nr:hypothetical protein RGR602_PC00739 [Rhizobium gallicum bv. gallicum R602sp]
MLLPESVETNFRSFMSEDLRAQFEKEVLGKVLLRGVGSAGNSGGSLSALHDLPMLQ